MRLVSGTAAPLVQAEPVNRLLDDGAAVMRGLRTVPRTVQRMATVREAFRLSRQAKAQRRVWAFYMEHHLMEQAREARVLMLLLLRSAGQQWRLTLAGGS